MCYEKKPTLSILLEGIKEIFTDNRRVASILDCKAPENISQQWQFNRVLGLYQNNIIASVEASVAPSLIKVSNFHFSHNQLTKGSNITTGASCRMTITHQKGLPIPETFKVPSWAGMDRIITYKALFPYSNQRADTSSHMPKEPATPSASRYKTTICRQFRQSIPCPYDEKCLFAHGEKEVRKNQSGNNPTTSEVPSEQAARQASLAALDLISKQKNPYPASAHINTSPLPHWLKRILLPHRLKRILSTLLQLKMRCLLPK